MSLSRSANKRHRASDASQGSKEEKSRSYSQSRQDGGVPEQYTPIYEQYIFTKGLDMDIFRGEEFLLEDSKTMCIELQKITCKNVHPTIFPSGSLHKVMNKCQNRNKALVKRDITPMIVPPIAALYFGGDDRLEHVCDEVNTFWYGQCALAGPRPRPDLAIGLFPSAFSDEEIEKLDKYESVDNWARFIGSMLFPFFMCEVKCGNENLNAADRQNMHSCSVAVRALLRIEQEADKYRPESEKKLGSLSGQILVFSLSHDQEDVRLFGHYALIKTDNRWSYHRYIIEKFYIRKSSDLLAIHGFVKNVFETYLPGLVSRIKNAIAALPERAESSGLSCAASDMSLNGETREWQNRVMKPRPPPSDSAFFRKPEEHPGTMQTEDMAAMRNQTDQLRRSLQQAEQQRQRIEQQMKEDDARMEQYVKEKDERMEQQQQEMISLSTKPRK